MQDHVFVRGLALLLAIQSPQWISFEIIKVFRTCSTRLFLCRPIQTSVVEHFFSSLLLLSYICVFFFVLQMDGAKQRDPDETAQSAISHLSSYYLTGQKDGVLLSWHDSL